MNQLFACLWYHQSNPTNSRFQRLIMVVYEHVNDERNRDGWRGDPPSLWQSLFHLKEPGESIDSRQVRCWSENHSSLLPLHSVGVKFDSSPIKRNVVPSPNGSWSGRKFSSRHPEEEGHSQASRIERLVKWHSHHHQSRHRRPLSLRSACERVRFQTHRADASLSSPCSNPRRVSVGLCLFLTTLSCVAPSLSLFQSGIRIQHGFVPTDFSAPLALVLRLLSTGPIRAGLFRHGDSLLLPLRRRNSVV